MINLIGRTKKERNLKSLYIYHPNLLQIFVDSAISGDGTKQIGHRDILSCGYENVCKQWQVIAALIHKAANIMSQDERGKKRVMPDGHILEATQLKYRIGLNNKGASMFEKRHVRCSQYNGIVYDIDTNNNPIYVRNQGMSFWL